MMVVKRIFDLLVASTGLLVLSPVYVLLAILVKLDSPGPVFYRSERVGKDGRLFQMIKFRSMVARAAQMGPAITARGDSRVTRVGRLLRKTKLDELPQLLNVLCGDMSLVGPRPEDPRYVALYTPQQRRVLRVRPGITSLASVKYRNEEAVLAQGQLDDIYTRLVMPEKLSIDLAYIDRMNFWLDAKIILMTAWALFRTG